MTDRELLELAALAAGMDFSGWAWSIYGGFCRGKYDDYEYWNPLTDDGDALRLSVRLGITIGPEFPDVVGKSLVRASWMNRSCSLGEYGEGDPYAATRRAIVRAAAEIGRSMKATKE